jgi:MerR family transcriptional regulator, light-induced transcriptional regulator
MFERLSAEPIYNTRAVVRRTGVPADTFRAWERRYGVPAPLRTNGNQRLYSERDIRTITWLREQTSLGLTISQAILLMRTAKPPPLPATPIQHQPLDRAIAEILSGTRINLSDPLASARKRLIEAFVNLDGQAAEHVLDETYAWADLEVVCVELLYNAVLEIEGRPDLDARVSPALQFSQAFVQRKFAALFNLSNPNEGRGPVLSASVSDEKRDLTLLLSAVFLSRAGFRVVYLGANLAFDALISAIRSVRPAVISLAATREKTADTLQEWISQLHEYRDETGIPFSEIPICYSGRIFLSQPGRRERIDGHFLGRAAQDSVAVVSSLVPQSPHHY